MAVPASSVSWAIEYLSRAITSWIEDHSMASAHMRRIGVAFALTATARIARSQQHASAALPAPTGRFDIGTTVFTITDSSRADSLMKGTRYRQLNVQLWYPVDARRGGVHARYLAEPALLPVLLGSQYYGIDSATLRTWGELTTHAWLNAAPRRGSYPILTFSHGLGVVRANYTSLVEELASHGFVLAMIDHPHSGVAVMPDGSIVSAADLGNAVNDPAATRRRAVDEAADITFVLDRLERRTVAPSAAAVGPTIDWRRAGAIGHSSGGLVAVEACNRDARLRACADLDGGPVTPAGEPMADFAARGVTKPALVLRSQPLYSDEDLARRGRTRAQWDATGNASMAALDSLGGRSSGPLFIARVAGTGHMSFSDGPFTMPTTLTQFGGKIIDATRGWKVITTTLREYFGAIFSTQPERFPGDLMSRFPELTLRRSLLHNGMP